MKMQSETLLSELIETTKINLNFVKSLEQKNDAELNWKVNSESWNILECLEHLNLYGHFYIPEIEKTLLNSKRKSEIQFTSGMVGNYFANSMLPKIKLNKMKTFKDKNPLNRNLNRKVIDEFVVQQNRIIDLLDQSRNVNLNKEKVKITISKWIRLKLGDTFRFVINHNSRHIKQIENIINEGLPAAFIRF